MGTEHEENEKTRGNEDASHQDAASVSNRVSLFI